jgi:hypothetical protein
MFFFPILFAALDSEPDRALAARLKAREPDVFKALAAAWAEWDAGMLPLDAKTFTHGITAKNLADHYGVVE